MTDHAAFFYGTLLFPGILYRVIYGSSKPQPWQKALTTIRPAILEGYRRSRVRGVDYPAIIACEGATVRGTVCTGLTDGDIWRLNVFEGDDYYSEKVRVKILKEDVGVTEIIPDDKINEYVVAEMDVNVYVWKDSQKSLLEKEPWDFEDFLQNKAKQWTNEHGGQDPDDGFADVEQAIAEVGELVGPRYNGSQAVDGNAADQKEALKAKEVQKALDLQS